MQYIPVLILHGSIDKNVPPPHAKKLAGALKKAGNDDVSVRIFEDLNHIFLKDPNGHPDNYSNLESFQVEPIVLGAIVDWIKDRF